jgi:hypothetical protein
LLIRARSRVIGVYPLKIELRECVEISIGEQLIRSHRAKHDRTREHGARSPTPSGRPHRINAA